MENLEKAGVLRYSCCQVNTLVAIALLEVATKVVTSSNVIATRVQ